MPPLPAFIRAFPTISLGLAHGSQQNPRALLERSLTSGTISSAGEQAKLVVRLVGRLVSTGLSAWLAWYVAFLISYRLKQSRKKLPLPPGPSPLPLIGSLHLVATEFDYQGEPVIHRCLMKLGKKYNGIFGVYFGSVYTVVITHPQVAEEAFGTHRLKSGERGRGAVFTDRSPLQSQGAPLQKAFDLFTRNGQGVGMSYGKFNTLVRGRVVSHITSEKIAKQNCNIVEEEVQSLIAHFRRKALRAERIDDLTRQLKRESLNIGFRMLFSKRFGATLDSDCINVGELIAYFFKNLIDPIDYLPIAKYIPVDTRKVFREKVKLRDEILTRVIGERKKSFLELRDQGKMSQRSQARDICDLFLFDFYDGFEQKDENGEVRLVKLTEDQLLITIWDIIFAFGDTTAQTNELFFYYMVNHPEVQKKVHEELDRVVGPDRLPTLADKPNLPYFWATLKEVMRMKILSPLMNPHYANKDTTLHDANGKEFFIPAGTQVFMHGFSMALDPEFWDNPEEFNPDRWFNERNKGLDLMGQAKRESTEHYKFMPFSVGPRMCPGYSFAKVAQFVQTACLMHCFRWKLTEDARQIAEPGAFVDGKLDMKESFGLTISTREHAKNGLIDVDLRPAAFLCKDMPGDVLYEKKFLDKSQKKEVKLVKKIALSSDTSLLRFTFPDTSQTLGLPIGKHFKVIMPNLQGVEAGKWNGRPDPEAGKSEIHRSYTPTSCDDDVGYVDLVVKHYRPGVRQNFPDGGKVSQQLGEMFVGEEITIQGPFGRVEYKGNGRFKVGSKLMNRKKIGMMAGGSGITPILQVVVAALKVHDDPTQFSLIYANQTEDDILLRSTLEELVTKHSDRFKLHYTLDRPPKTGWKYSSGFIDSDMIRAYMPPPGDDTLILMCGPPPMIKYACRANLEKIGYAKESQVEF